MVSGACGLKTMVSSAFCRKLQGNLQSFKTLVANAFGRKIAGKPAKLDGNRIVF